VVLHPERIGMQIERTQRRAGWWLDLTACLAALAALALSGCGGGAGTAAGALTAPGIAAPSSAAPDFFPLAVGHRWVYAESVDGAAPLQTAFRVIGTQTVGGAPALLAQADDGGTTRQELYVRTAAGITRWPAASADAVTQAVGPVLVLRFPVQAGDSFDAVDKTLATCYDFDSDGVLDPLSVQSRVTVVGFETLDTPVGSIVGVAHLRTVLSQSTTLSSNGALVTVQITTDDWYAPGLGPLRRLTVTQANGTTQRADATILAFRVGSVASENVPPVVDAVLPADGSTQAAGAVIQVVYSEAMDPTSGPVLALTAPDGSPVAADIVWADARTARLMPPSALAAGRYTVRASTAAQDLAGNALATARVWSFTVAPAGP
jgi:hypothetical protein